MSRLRCWPGALAEIIRSQAGNEGRRVAVLREAREGDDGWLAYPQDVGKLWLVQPLQPLTAVLGFLGFEFGRRQTIAATAFPDAWLRPIEPPPASETETVAEVLEAARNEPAEV